MTLTKPKSPVGITLRTFSEKTFGVLVDGTIISHNKSLRTVTIACEHNWVRWNERFQETTEFYRHRGHANQGDPFTLDV